MATPTLILASRSPRRAQLLRDAGLEFEQIDPPFEDPPQPAAGTRVDPVQLATQLALKKALSVRDPLLRQPPQRPRVVLGADTICLDGATLIGQPADQEQARQMIQRFANRTHRVLSAAALADTGGATPCTLHDIAEVSFGPLPENTLSAYLASGRWRGKAGAYHLFDCQQQGWPIRVRGDPATVVGLPMQALQPVLSRWLASLDEADWQRRR